jgi:hypothetical protein
VIMLFPQEVLKKIKSGEITRAFRRWKQPSVKAGSVINTALGQIEIHRITKVKLQEILKDDIRKSGFSNIEEMQQSFYQKDEGDIYRIELAFSGPDPRIELRNTTDLSKQELIDIRKKLDRYDKFSKEGPWTLTTFKLIADQPHQKAADLAWASGFEKEWLKVNIRKLKNMGLTISHNTGYELSPRGKEVEITQINKSVYR